MNLTVVQVVQHLRPGGLETMVLELLRHAAVGNRVHVISLEGCADEALAAWPRLREHAARLHFLAKRPGLRPGTVLRLAGLLRDLGADAVHTHHVGPLLYGGAAARLAGVRRVVHTEHDAWHLDAPRRRRLQRLAVALVRPALVADAHTVRDAAERSLPGHRFQVIPNGVDTRRFSPGDRAAARLALDLPGPVRLVGCAARLEPVKGHELLLEAIARLPREVHLALAGTGSRESALRQRARELGIGDRVHFLGQVAAMVDFYRALDLFCLVSHQEGLPLAPLEAQACGIPAVVTDVGGCHEAICPRVGRLLAGRDPENLAALIAERLGDDFAHTPRQHVVEHGDVRCMTQAYEALYAS